MINNDRVRFTLRLPSDLLETLKKEAHVQGISINSMILKILWDWFENS